MKQVIERCDICKRICDNGFKLNGIVMISEISGQHTRVKKSHDEVCRTCVDIMWDCYNGIFKDLPEVTK